MPHIAAAEFPDGLRAECPICRKLVYVNPSEPFGDAPCPNCGTLLFVAAAHRQVRIHAATTVSDYVRQRLQSVDLEAMDSLDLAELVMELEDSEPDPS
jgi:hypothetical protein